MGSWDVIFGTREMPLHYLLCPDCPLIIIFLKTYIYEISTRSPYHLIAASFLLWFPIFMFPVRSAEVGPEEGRTGKDRIRGRKGKKRAVGWNADHFTSSMSSDLPNQYAALLLPLIVVSIIIQAANKIFILIKPLKDWKSEHCSFLHNYKPSLAFTHSVSFAVAKLCIDCSCSCYNFKKHQVMFINEA